MYAIGVAVVNSQLLLQERIAGYLNMLSSVVCNAVSGLEVPCRSDTWY